MQDIEIGIDIVAKLYLHVASNDLPSPFEVKKITDVKEGELGTIVTYSGHDFIVTESVEDIKKSIEDAQAYRDAAINAINLMLKE